MTTHLNNLSDLRLDIIKTVWQFLIAHPNITMAEDTISTFIAWLKLQEPSDARNLIIGNYGGNIATTIRLFYDLQIFYD